jgi:2-polyprenyl-6-methoxyphenol hydroxylase-like FAD-dependent oxidoreductase
MRGCGEQAVVIGAGMGGLLAAGALAGSFEQVTIVERDALPATAGPRRAVPQGRHAHALLPRGQACLEALFEGIVGELIAAGAHPYRALAQMRFSLAGHELARCDTGRESIVASRPLIEAHVRRRVAALGNVAIVERCDATALSVTRDGRRVDGVKLVPRASGASEERLPADLVVVSTGRGGRLPAWLAGLGRRPPREERLEVDFAYASRHLAIEPGALGDDKLVLIGARPGLPRTLALFAQEDGRWLLTLGGYGGHHPPREAAAFLAFAESVAPPDVAAAIRAAETLDDIVRFRFPANVRRHYTDLPGGLLPLGDAVCAFNPIYGQGMTVAALEAMALREALGAGPAATQRRYLAATRRIVDHAWQFAGGADLAQPAVAGRRPARVRLANAYLGRLFAAAEHDEELALAFLFVSGMLAPPASLMRPAVVRRAVRGRRGTRPTAGQDAVRTAAPAA